MSEENLAQKVIKMIQSAARDSENQVSDIKIAIPGAVEETTGTSLTLKGKEDITSELEYNESFDVSRIHTWP